MSDRTLRDDRALRQLERAIAAFEARSVCHQASGQAQLAALHAERAMLLSLRGRG